LYFPFPVAFTHNRQLFAFTVLVAGKRFAVYHADNQAVRAAVFAPGGFLFIEAAVILLRVSRDAAVQIDDGWTGHRCIGSGH